MAKHRITSAVNINSPLDVPEKQKDGFWVYYVVPFIKKHPVVSFFANLAIVHYFDDLLDILPQLFRSAPYPHVPTIDLSSIIFWMYVVLKCLLAVVKLVLTAVQLLPL